MMAIEPFEAEKVEVFKGDGSYHYDVNSASAFYKPPEVVKTTQLSPEEAKWILDLLDESKVYE